MVNNVSYSDDIQNWILMNLDGWIVEDTVTDGVQTITPFMNSLDATEKANKRITPTECQLFYEETLDQAYMFTNRLNIDDLTEIEARIFIRAVCKWTASNLWNKYNIRVNNEDMEDTYIQSYGGLLYRSAQNTLRQFINQRITGVIVEDDTDDIWMV